MHDLVIRGGTVVDGSGSPRCSADVAVSEGRIVEVGPSVGAGRRELDADGLLVTPGWVDVHSHYDGQALWDPLLETSAAHGVTTSSGPAARALARLRPDSAVTGVLPAQRWPTEAPQQFQSSISRN